MAFAIDVEFLRGVVVASHTRADRKADWPLQPDRLFSALVAAYGSSGKTEAQQAALEWLEALSAPDIIASDAFLRAAPDVFVPVNDIVGRPESLPAYRPHQPRVFPAAVPEHPVVTYLWEDELPDWVRLPLIDLVRNVPYLGHSTSLCTCRLASTDIECGELRSRRPAQRWIYVGRFAELEHAWLFGQRPPSAMTLEVTEPTAEVAAPSVYGRDWIVLECGDGARMSLTAAALVAGTLRRALLASLEDQAIEILTGHSPDGTASKSAHLAIITLPFVGHKHADGAVHGLAIVLPRTHEEAVSRALSGSATSSDQKALEISLKLQEALDQLSNRDGTRLVLSGKGVSSLEFLRQPRALKTLAPERWIDDEDGRYWATVTPLVLDKSLKSRVRSCPERNAVALQLGVAQACKRIGLPEPIRVEPMRSAAISGSIGLLQAGSPRLSWYVPERYRTRPLIHARILFAEPVEGPLLLGAGRHFGLGLCAPIRRRKT